MTRNLLLRQLALASVLMLGACTTAAIKPLPDPLPATLEWAQTQSSEGSFLGLTVRENDSGSLESLSFDPGVRITAVAQGSPASEAGLRIGDVLLELAGTVVHDPGELSNMLAELEPGAAVQAQVQRGDSGFAIELTPRAMGGADAAPERLWRADPARSQAGWLAGQGGVVLVTSDPDGPFPRAGVDVGDVVLALNGSRVMSDLDLVQRLQAQPEGGRVDVTFLDSKSGSEKEARVKLASPPRRVTGFNVPVLTNYSSDPEGKQTSFVLVDLWLISLLRYERDGVEKRWSILRFFRFSSGIGELGS